MNSGYTYCRCRDCFVVVVSDDDTNPDYCDDCIKAGCHEKPGLPEVSCDNPHSYGGLDGAGHCGDPECCGPWIQDA